MTVVLFLFQIHLIYHVLIRYAVQRIFNLPPGQAVSSSEHIGLCLCVWQRTFLLLAFQSYDTRFKIYSSSVHVLVIVMHVRKVAESEYYIRSIFM